MFIRQIYRTAYSLDISKSDLKRIKLCVRLSLLASVASFFVIALDGVQYKWSNVFFDFIGLIAYLFSLYFLRVGKYGIGKAMIFIGGNIILVFNASREGINAGNQFLFLPLFIAPLLLFSRKEYKYAIAIWALTIASFIFLETTDYSFFIYPEQNPELLYINYLFCFVLSLLLLTFFVMSFDKITRESELKLEKANTKLASKISDLKKANAELDSFVYKASHDLRSPLTSLMGLIELIKNEKDQEVLNYYLALEEKIVHRLDNYILDILNISRNSRLPLKVENIDFKELYDSAMNQLSFHENASLIKSEVIISGEDFYSDKMRVVILLNNLVSNAIRYFDTAKEKHWIKFHVHITPDFATLKFMDNGIGIEATHIDNVFQMFYRATENKSGSGLGLYIVKETIDKLKGEVGVRSENGKWTEFIIKIPNLLKEKDNK